LPNPAANRCSFLDEFFFLYEIDNLAEIIDDGFQFRNRITGEVLRLGKFVAVFERFVFQPGDIEFVVARFDFAKSESTKSTKLTRIGTLLTPFGFAP
jgi:hypothetical protein